MWLRNDANWICNQYQILFASYRDIFVRFKKNCEVELKFVEWPKTLILPLLAAVYENTVRNRASTTILMVEAVVPLSLSNTIAGQLEHKFARFIPKRCR